MEQPPGRLILPAKTALFFFAGALLLYLAAGLFLQKNLGLLGIFLNQALFLFLPVVWISGSRGCPIEGWPQWLRPTFREIAQVVVLTLLVSLSIDLLVSLQDSVWPLPEEVERFYEKLVRIDSRWEIPLKILVLSLTPALAEEIFFRGVLQPSWVNRFGRLGGLCLTSLAFAFAHGNPWHFHFYFVLGLYLGWLLEWRGKLWLPVLAHLVNNLWALLWLGS